MHHGRKTKNAKCTAKHKYFSDLVCNDAVTASFVRYPPYRDRTQGCSWHFGKGGKGRAVWHSDGKGKGGRFSSIGGGSTYGGTWDSTKMKSNVPRMLLLLLLLIWPNNSLHSFASKSLSNFSPCTLSFLPHLSGRSSEEGKQTAAAERKKRRRRSYVGFALILERQSKGRPFRLLLGKKTLRPSYALKETQYT